MSLRAYQGGQAQSPFRLEQLKRRLQSRINQLRQVNARYLHLVSIDTSKGTLDDSKLARLLDYGADGMDIECCHRLWVVPRLGTTSAWSTKATDIASRCGLNSITRLERGIEWQLRFDSPRPLGQAEKSAIAAILADRMTESVLFSESQFAQVFTRTSPARLDVVRLLEAGRHELEKANQQLGLALAKEEIDYLYQHAVTANRNLTNVELMMFSQINSEHCRHKIFNASWTIDGKAQPYTLFDMIRHTHSCNPEGTLVAYKDNAAVIEGVEAGRFFPDHQTHRYGYSREPVHILTKVETHNHPTAISPYPGAATGSGGEIRDEGATGRGGKPKAGITGFSVSNLRLPGALQPWEGEAHMPAHIASPLQIMLEGPIGGAAFNNEFGRPNIAGYFRTFEQTTAECNDRFGYHKPIMIAGGLGNIRAQHVEKKVIPAGAKIVVLGGPAMLIGLGGGAASSVASGHGDVELDFASVQRGNPEMQRRCQEVIDTCWAMGDANPIVSIHDVGAGGLSNAVPELVHDAGLGGDFELRQVLNDQPGMSPMEIWCNEAQERYVVAIESSRLDEFKQICNRERCLYCVIGVATGNQQLRLTDSLFGSKAGHPIEMGMDVLFGNPPKMHRDVNTISPKAASLTLDSIVIDEAVGRLLKLPAVADKTFLVTIADRSVGGMISRDQMVGPWQVPVADVAVTTSSFDGYHGEAMALGERSPIALLDPAASSRMAVGELMTNLAAAPIDTIGSIKLSANWMAAAGVEGQDAALFAAVKAVGLGLCPELGVSIPVGKDSMSMRTVWQEAGQQHTVAAPVSLIVSGFAPVSDVRKVLTPVLETAAESELILIDLGEGRNRLGASCLAQVYNATGERPADVDNPGLLKRFFAAINELNARGLLLAYHDRADGGLFVSLVEMAFASRCGLAIALDGLSGNDTEILFNEELGAVIQINAANKARVWTLLEDYELAHCAHPLGRPLASNKIRITNAGAEVFQASRVELHRQWSHTSYAMQSLRDNPECAREEYDRLLDENDPGLFARLTYSVSEDICAPFINTGKRPKVAILREQGVNSHVEMAAAFDRAGFAAHDVHMSDLFDERQSLDSFVGIVACGGFSFGDVLGAGQGWAKSILFNQKLNESFTAFFHRPDTFSLGVCNGCQMMAGLKALIPGAQLWPDFLPNRSEQYEARQVMVRIEPGPSIFFRQMHGSEFPVVVAHGEGRVEFSADKQLQQAEAAQLIVARFIDNAAQDTQVYPYNPNGSQNAITALTSTDGRSTILMPHPERVFRSVTNSWRSPHWQEDSPWMRIFRNARVWVD